jgi:hypothetical protein
MPDTPETESIPSALGAPVEAAPAADDIETLSPDDRDALHLDDPDDVWQTRPVKRGVRLGIPSAILLALLAVAGGFWGGAVAATSRSALASRFAAAAGTGGFAGFGGASGLGGAATTGLVTGVKGQTLYITTSAGKLVAVTLSPTGTVTEEVSGLSGLKVGQTVVVRGTTAADGAITATSVIQGASATGASFGGARSG